MPERDPSPPVSIVILTYNGEAHIRPLLDSLNAQTYPRERMEIIVVDNASSDHTVDIIKKEYASVRVIALPDNLGFARGNNLGLKNAGHDRVAFLNQDVICHEDWLLELVRFMTRCNLPVAGSNIIAARLDKTLPETGKRICYYDLTCYGYGAIRQKNAARVSTRLLSGCAFMIQQSLIRDMGGLFDEHLFLYAEDTDLSLRILSRGLPILIPRNAVVYHAAKTGVPATRKGLSLMTAAIYNRVYVFYKNMPAAEFFRFFPFLCMGGVFKWLEFPVSRCQKGVLLVPFGMFQMIVMLAALVRILSRKSLRRLNRFLKPGLFRLIFLGDS